jgi:hypothetical protein
MSAYSFCTAASPSLKSDSNTVIPNISDSQTEILDIIINHHLVLIVVWNCFSSSEMIILLCVLTTNLSLE